MLLKMLLFSFFLSLAPIHSVHSEILYNQQVLKDIIEKVQSAKLQGKNPIVLFDLDDTLINTRERNLRILQDFVEQNEIQQRFPTEISKIQQLTVIDIKYLLSDTLNGIGVTDPNLIKLASDFWLPRFFSDQYCSRDQANSGAAKYLNDLVNAGAQIVYLTGRDIPRMQSGTIISLQRNFFPFPVHASLLMKPNQNLDDLTFKKDSFAQVSAMGEVEGVFENEPANINAMNNYFSNAIAVFIDTIHSSRPDIPNKNISWVSDFNLN
jgi:hypothetical protein